MRTPWRSFAIVTSAALILATGCSGSDSGSGGDAKEIKIGVIDPMSGFAKAVGEDDSKGAELAVEVINGDYPDIDLPLAKGKGLPNLNGAKLKLVKGDSQGDPDIGAKEAQRLVNDEKAVALIGASQSGVTKTASQAAERLKVPFVNGNSTSPALTTRGLDYFFRTGPTDQTYVDLYISLVKDQAAKGVIKGKKIAVLHTNDDFGNGGGAAAKKTSEANGYTVQEISYDPKAQDLSPVAQQVRNGNPDVVFMLSLTDDGIKIAKAFADLKYTPKSVMSFGTFSDPTTYDTTDKAQNINGFINRVAWSAENGSPTAKKVEALFEQKYKGRKMTEHSARTFTATMTLAQAMNDARSSDPDKVRAALQNIDIAGRDTMMPWNGIKFDDNHQNTGASGIVQQFIDGKWKVIYPNDVKQGDMIYPVASARQ